MPKQRETTPLSEGDQTWLGSTRGITTNRTETLIPNDFPAAQRTDGFIKSGTPVSYDATNKKLIPYVGTGTPNKLAGFIFTDQVVGATLTEKLNVPVMDHGRVRTSRLPVEFTVPTPANDGTTIVFVN